MTRGTTRSAIGELATIVLSVVLLISLLGTVKCAPRRRNDLRTLRLCSKDLSDALYLVCRDRGGFNEPFSYSDEDEPRRAPGPGLVEECCHHSCSIDQLQQYCKLTSEEKSADCQDVMKEKEESEESFLILNLPYSSVGMELTPEERLRSRIDHAGSAKKSKDRRVKSARRRKGLGGRDDGGMEKIDTEACKRDNGDHSECQRRRRRRRRRRLGKAKRRTTVKADYPKTTISPPNSTDKIL